ncbi:hypothetical protein [Rhizobium leguminosarum]|uniref:hypothetical protein n=1 Tax=Rhizobium leguminosarum TaxID=384 RepID=UPI001C93C38C|nr:hypothetical protein [Rhizobium leguminosarum]MBY5366100.1 hypothetical protein [Rhizobium leguminosarum]
MGLGEPGQNNRRENPKYEIQGQQEQVVSALKNRPKESRLGKQQEAQPREAVCRYADDTRLNKVFPQLATPLMATNPGAKINLHQGPSLSNVDVRLGPKAASGSVCYLIPLFMAVHHP